MHRRPATRNTSFFTDGLMAGPMKRVPHEQTSPLPPPIIPPSTFTWDLQPLPTMPAVGPILGNMSITDGRNSPIAKER